ncbi:MAG TPA: winged helix-turn-helix transcriptional regulator [Gemmatimonadales bacterium]|nr:winged helix-turn-helix transcriptional regulator [Gemmatimonadales bacterium]
MGTALHGTTSLSLLPPAYRGPRGQILVDLKRNGSNTAKGLADALGLSLNAVRHHLRELEAEDLIRHRREQRGLGAPTFAFHLSQSGEELFPQRYREIVTEVLDRIAERAGREAVTGALESRFESLALRIEAGATAVDPEARLDIVRQALQNDGFMADWSAEEGGFRLTEHHCAFRELAARFPEICEIEARFLSRVLSARVERSAHMLAGCSACQYRLRFNEAPGAAHAAPGRESA